MKVLIVEPHKRPRREDIPHSLESFHGIVGGYIQAIYPWEDRVAVVCDDEGLMKHYEPNRYFDPGVLIVGTFFICGISEDDFDDLPDDLAEKYERLLYHPQAFFRTPSGILALSADGKLTQVM